MQYSVDITGSKTNHATATIRICGAPNIVRNCVEDIADMLERREPKKRPSGVELKESDTASQS